MLILETENQKKFESKQKLEIAKNWILTRKLSEELELRVLNYFNFAQEKFADLIQYDFLDNLPLSLKTELTFYIHKDLIPKVKLFELGDPAFVMSFVRHLKPKLFMAQDSNKFEFLLRIFCCFSQLHKVLYYDLRFDTSVQQKIN